MQDNAYPVSPPPAPRASLLNERWFWIAMLCGGYMLVNYIGTLLPLLYPYHYSL